MTQPMPRSEHNSHNRVARLLITPVADSGLGYEHLGNWSKRDHNCAIEVDLLRVVIQLTH
jgi:type I restriction enzyme R subunit